MDPRHLVVDVQIVMIGSGLSDPPDDGSAARLLRQVEKVEHARLVWDQDGMIKSQYERKLKPQTFGHEWFSKLLLSQKVVSVPRCKLEKGQKMAILATGLVGEDLNFYVRTAANSPDRVLVSQDSDYATVTCAVLKKQLGISVVDSADGRQFLDDG